MGVQGHSGCEEGHLVLSEGPSKGQPSLQRDPCCPASVEVAPLMYLEWSWGGRGNPCCARGALLSSEDSMPLRMNSRRGQVGDCHP